MKMVRLVAVAAFLTVSLATAADDGKIPGRFSFKYRDAPIWISSAEAITAEGTLRPDVPRPAHLKLRLSELERGAANRTGPLSNSGKAADDCDVTFSERFTDGPDDFPVNTLAELAEVAATRSVISGVVSGSAVGLHDGIPYTVLQIDTNLSDSPVGPVYLMYPRGRVRFDDVTLCNDNPIFAELPAIGDPIAFVASAPIDSTGTLFFTPRSWIWYEHLAALVGPPSLRADSSARRLSSVRAVTEHLRAKQPHDKRQ